MKKIALLVLSGLMATSVSARMSLVTIDTNRLLRESKQGQALQKEISEKAKGLQERQQKLVADLQDREKHFQKMSAALTPAAQQAELMDLQFAQRQAQRELEGMQEDVRLLAQNKESALRKELNGMAQDVAKTEEWGAVLDASQPFVLASAGELDVTNTVLKHADEVYAQEHKVAQAASPAVSA